MPRLTAIDRFRSEFRRWVAAHNEAKSFATNPDALLDMLEHRIGQDRLARIGSAYLNRWLQTEDDPAAAISFGRPTGLVHTAGNSRSRTRARGRSRPVGSCSSSLPTMRGYGPSLNATGTRSDSKIVSWT
jgi:hypothetical protein